MAAYLAGTSERQRHMGQISSAREWVSLTVSNKSESGSTLRLSLEEESFHGEHLKGCLGGVCADVLPREGQRGGVQ